MLTKKFPYFYMIGLCLCHAGAQANQKVIYPSYLYPGVSWEMQPAKTNQPIYQYRQDKALQQQWAAPDLNKPRYRPLDNTAKPINSYQYRSEIPDDVLSYNRSEFKQGLVTDYPEKVRNSTAVPQHNTYSLSNYRSQQQENEYKQGLPDYQPRSLLSNYPPFQNTYPAPVPRAYPQPAQENTAQPSYNPWASSSQQNPWQTSQSMYQNLMETVPNLSLPTLPQNGNFYFQQNNPFHQQHSQPRDLPFSPEQVFIVPSHWIQPPTASSQLNTEHGQAKFTVYPIEQVPFDELEVW